LTPKAAMEIVKKAFALKTKSSRGSSVRGKPMGQV
jgi:hypothetical protein